MRAWSRVAAAAVVASLAGAALAGSRAVIESLVNRLTFFPDRRLAATPAGAGLAFEEVWIDTEDGERLHGWWIPAVAPRRAAVLYLHGNAGNIGLRIDKARFLAGLGCDVLLFDYRGYGRSTGSPTETGVSRDARAAWRFLAESRGVDPRTCVLWGKSLGGPIAARLAAGDGAAAAGLVIESSFTSGADMAPLAAPWVPFARRLAAGRFDTVAAVREARMPKLFIHGRADAVVPFALGERLFAAAAEPKRFLDVPAGGHGDAWRAGGGELRAAVDRFIGQAVGEAGGSAGSGG